MNRFLAVVGWPFGQFTRLIPAVVGDITWQPPGWAGAAKARVARRPILSGASFLSLVVLLLGGWWIWNWYAHLPKPPTVAWVINMAAAPDPDTKFQPQHLALDFDSSVARLESIGKDVTQLVTLSPKIEGKWSWSGGSELLFEPTENWPAATTFRIKLAPELFSKHARIETLTKEFKTAPFTVVITDQTFYVNPKDPATKQITATLTFSHPVDRASLEKNLTLAMESGEQVFQNAPSATGRCTFTFDKLDRVAYVRSVNVNVPKESGHAILSVTDSVRTISGDAQLDQPQQVDVLVPSISDLFHIATAQTTIVTNDEGDPEQALILVTSVGVKPELLAQALHAWILPKPKRHRDPFDDRWINAWDSPAEIDADVLAKSTPVALTLVPSQEEYATLHSFKVKVPEDAWVYL